MLPMIARSFLTLSLLAMPSAALGQAFSAYSHFDSLTTGQAGAVRVKFTHVGPHDSGCNTLALSPGSGPIGLQPFLAYYRPPFQYEKDFMVVNESYISASELEALIDSIGTLAAITAGGVDSLGSVSFSLVDTLGPVHGFEAIVSQSNGEALFAKAISALVGNPSAVRAMRECACSFAMYTGTLATRVAPAVSVSGFRRILGTDDYVATAKVSNTTGSTLSAPVVLFPGVAGMGVRLRAEDGWSCKIHPIGEPYVVLPVGPSGLANGSTVDIKVTIRNPGAQPIKVTPKVYAGPGVY